MHVVADLCVIPLGVGVSVSSYIRQCEAVLSQYNLKTQIHAYGTNLEGEWDEVLRAVKACHEALHEAGVPRVSTSLKIGTRTDKHQTIESKIQSAAL